MCNVLDPVGCAGDVAGAAVESGVTKALREFAEGCASFAADLLHWALTWWVQTPTPNPDQPAVRVGQHYLWPLIGFVLVASILAAGIRVALSRKGAPLLDVGLGMVKYALTATMGLTALGAAVAATDGFSQWMLDAAAPRFEATLKAALNPQNMSEGAPGPGAYIGLLYLSSNLMFLSGIQWILGFLRQAGIIIYAALLPLAAAGSLSQLGKQWLPRVVSTLLTLVFYKPAAAFILVIGELFLGSGNNVTTMLTGMMVILASAIAMPAMYKFLQPFGIQLGSGGGAFAAAGGALANMPRGGSGSSGSGSSGQQSPAVQQANYMQANGPHGGGQSATPPSGSGASPSTPSTSPGSGAPSATRGRTASPTPATTTNTTAPATSTATGAGETANAARGGVATAASGPAAPVIATGVAATQEVKKAGEQAADSMSSNDASDPPQGANT